MPGILFMIFCQQGVDLKPHISTLFTGGLTGYTYTQILRMVFLGRFEVQNYTNMCTGVPQQIRGRGRNLELGRLQVCGNPQ
jgi:hypothetical protein